MPVGVGVEHVEFEDRVGARLPAADHGVSHRMLGVAGGQRVAHRRAPANWRMRAEPELDVRREGLDVAVDICGVDERVVLAHPGGHVWEGGAGSELGHRDGRARHYYRRVSAAAETAPA